MSLILSYPLQLCGHSHASKTLLKMVKMIQYHKERMGTEGLSSASLPKEFILSYYVFCIEHLHDYQALESTTLFFLLPYMIHCLSLVFVPLLLIILVL